MNRGYRNRLTVESELVELVKFIGEMSYAVAFVDAGNYRLSALFEHYRDILIRGCESRAHVTHKYDNVGILDSHLCLKFHLREDDVVALGLDSSRIDNAEFFAAPLGLTVDSVTRYTGYVLYYRAALTDKLIEKCAFAHVRASYYCYNGFCHFNLHSAAHGGTNISQ